MSFAAAKNTLRYQLNARPLVMHRDLRQVKLVSVLESLDMLRQESNVRPECEALSVYFLIHAVAEIRKGRDLDEPLTDNEMEVVDLYHSVVGLKALRMLYYIMLICYRESRHCGNFDNLDVENTWTDRFGHRVVDFTRKIVGCGYSTAMSTFWGGYEDEDLSEVKLGDFVDFMSAVFVEGHYSGGYGGPAWANVANAMKNLVDGVYSLEMMVDVGFTLAHNNGPIFNKGVFYDEYQSGTLIKVLDVQRSGQIPQLIMTGTGDINYIMTGVLKNMAASVNTLLRGKMEGYVDWYLVEELGSVNSYEDEKEKQVAEYGMPEKHAILAAEIMDAKIAKAAGYFQVTGEILLKKIDMVRAA